jgi:hypothetical protein
MPILRLTLVTGVVVLLPAPPFKFFWRLELLYLSLFERNVPDLGAYRSFATLWGQCCLRNLEMKKSESVIMYIISLKKRVNIQVHLSFRQIPAIFLSKFEICSPEPNILHELVSSFQAQLVQYYDQSLELQQTCHELINHDCLYKKHLWNFISASILLA